MAWWCEGMEEPRHLIAPLSCTLNSEGLILSLKHPKSGEPTNYVFMDGNLREVNWFKQSYGSWFLGDYVCEDGSLYICTPVDPVFILLPIFEAARMSKANNGVFRQLDEILYVDGYPGYQHLMSIAGDHMQMVCEVKEIGSSKFYRLDDSKVIAWLCCKVQQLKETIPKLGKNFAAREERDTLKDIISLLGEYLNDDPWLTPLCQHLHLDMQESKNNALKFDASPVFLDNTASARPVEGKLGKSNSMSSKGKQPKKMKLETDSKNIKDMFSRATRSRNNL
ncbi:ribonuclease H2 subunit B [Ananas comosus]|uniref:Ribonuclease H2 subunit B n=1 Tax=Ananas comosus TaxID=4615 RepID=A0A6P5GRN4_ANACO|nr:ribonuclease H2 subunit B [Ananas comosus]